ncbi:MAG: glycosyltransferase [Anaerolineae bacterium]|nr:glycosyltransferase [Anaerolineae bacterium]
MNMSRRVRVLSVTKSTGGLAHYNTRLCARLDPATFDVHVVCLSEDNAAYAAALAAQGIAATPMAMDRYRINPASDFRLAWRLLQHVRQARYDVIVGHGAKAGFLVRLVGRLTGAPAIYTLHSTPFLERVQGRKAALYRPLERFAARLGGHIVTITHAMRDELVRCRIVAPDRVTVIHTGIVLSDFDAPPPHAAACAALGLDPARPVVGVGGAVRAAESAARLRARGGARR